MITLERPLYTSEVVDIFLDEEHKLVHLKWKRYADSRQFREALTMAMEFVKQYHLEGWLGNLKQMESILPADQEWSYKIWFPELAKTSLKKMAIVTSLDYFNNVAVKKIMDNAEPHLVFETRYFVDQSDARAWLIS